MNIRMCYIVSNAVEREQGEKNKAREGEQGKNTVRIEENFFI